MDRTETVVDVEAGFGVRERRPQVALTLGRTVVLLTPQRAFRIARLLIDGASAALADAAVVDAMGGERLTTDEVAAVLLRLRASRAAVDQHEGTEDD